MEKYKDYFRMYFVKMGNMNIDNMKLKDIPISIFENTPQKALVTYMKNQYDTFVGADGMFRVTNTNSRNIYNYKINLYSVDSRYMDFINKYRNGEEAIYVFEDDKTKLSDIIKDVYPDKIIFLEELLNEYGMGIIQIDSEKFCNNSYDIAMNIRSKIYDYAREMDPSDSFIKPVVLPESIKNSINKSSDIIVGVYDIFETISKDKEHVANILNDLKKNLKIDSDKYYVDIEEISEFYGEIRVKSRDQILEHNINSPVNRGLWNTILEYGDGFCGINFNIRDLYYSNVVECVDISDKIDRISDREIISESRRVYGGEYSPVFIVLSNTGSIFSDIIKGVTKAPYNHASISFDPDLEKLYSFTATAGFMKTGFTIESLNRSYLERFDNVKTQIYAVFVNQSQLRKMNEYLDIMLANFKKTKYNFTGLLGYILQKPMSRENKKFCSEFVDEIFKLVDMDLTNKKSGLVQPYDFANSRSDVIFKVYDGDMNKLNPNRIGAAIRRIFDNNKSIISEDTFIISEAKSFPVQFDKDGNLLIKNMRKMDYQSEYEDSHRLLGLYEKGNNLEGIKFELSKLWFVNSLIEEELYSRRRPAIRREKELLDIRARILNDFHKYLVYVGNEDSKFNFREYYDNSPFSDAEIQINKHTIDGIGKMVKTAIGLI